MPHSEICGSRDICSLPQLIAACHVFHRLLVPRHPPCALTCLTICSRPSTVSSRRLSSIALLPRLLFFHELVFCIVWDGSLPIPDVCSSDYSMCSFQGTFLIINSCSKQSNSLWLARHRYSINILWHPVVSLCENNLILQQAYSNSAAAAFIIINVEITRFELVTPCLQGRCSPN